LPTSCVCADTSSIIIQSAQATGASVYAAVTPDEASRYIIDLARDRVVSDIIKVKSMVSEEIRLNHSLEAAGLRVVESDVGEWIVQLSGERPSHIIAPAIHKNRRQIAELFSRVTGRYVSRDDVTEQLGVAREALRDEFFRAGMGISGANAIVAETGTVMLVTNEGNAELTTSLPPIHVVLVGVEKLLPRLEDAMLELELLAPSATGQAATVYVSAITGPADPNQELHIVLLDNGRSAMQRSVLFDEALRCIRCGACSNICPVYRRSGGLSYGATYSGPIGLIIDPTFNARKYSNLPFASSLNGSCSNVCPVKINIHEQIYAWLRVLVERHEVPLAKKAAMKAAGALLSQPAAYRAAIAAADTALAHLPRFVIYNSLNAWGKHREVPHPPKQTFHSWYQANRGTKQ